MNRSQFLALLLCLFVSACARSQPAPVEQVDSSPHGAAADRQIPPPDRVFVEQGESVPSENTTVNDIAEPESVAARQIEPDDDAVPNSSLTDDASTVGDLIVGEAVRHKNLSIFPIVSKTPLTGDRFITLDEGLRAGTVEIFERSASPAAISAATNREESARASSGRSDASEQGRNRTRASQSANQLPADRQPADRQSGDEVNRLMVVNRAEKPLYLVPGEVIVGGSQDRTISEETVIAATGQPVPIDVYCVEHGRWSRRSAAQTAMMLADLADPSSNSSELAGEAVRGKFVAKGGFLNKSSRMAAQASEGQQKVWEKVADANAKSRVRPSSVAFTANFTDKAVVQQLQPYIETLAESVATQDRVVGVIVAVNGKIESADVFESTPLFLKLWPKLLRCYALDALHATDAAKEEQTANIAEAATFLATVTEGVADETKQASGGLVVAKRTTKETVSFLAKVAPAADAAPPAPNGLGRAVHAAGFAKTK